MASFRSTGTVYLFLLYGKNEQGKLNADEKRQCRQLAREISHLLDERFGSV